MQDKFAELKFKLAEIYDLKSVADVLDWDQATYMPRGASEARARHISLVNKISQEKFADPKMGELLDELGDWAKSLPEDSDEAALVRVTKREYEKAIRIPSDLVEETTRHYAIGFQKWSEAYKNNDFKSVIPILERNLELSRQLANCFPGYEHIADSLVNLTDYGYKVSDIRSVFSQLREALVPLVQKVTEKENVDNSALKQYYPIDKQKTLVNTALKEIGYDFTRGRLDETHHPFMITFSLFDIRITTRFDVNNFEDGFFSTIHEGGHGMYEQGINTEFESSPLAKGTSSGVHESQSRLWENVVGRSYEFWKFFYPITTQVFQDQLGNVSLDEFYRMINRVSNSLIRVDADELTYNLHVMIRFDMETQLLEGSLDIVDLPEAWNARYESDLGIKPPDDTRGVLQDVHWFAGPIGGVFQGYTLGNIMSAFFYKHALQEYPSIKEDMTVGNFDNLHSWMKDNIYTHGSKYTAQELVKKVSGGELTIQPYIDYLTEKYSELYKL